MAAVKTSDTSDKLLFIALVFLILPQLQHITAPLAFFCLLIICWRGLSLFFTRIVVPGKWARIFLALAGIAIVISEYHTIIGSVAGSALLLFMLCMKWLEVSDRRDRYIIIFLSYFVVIISFLFDQSLLRGMYMLLIVMLLTTSLVSLHHPGNWSVQKLHLRITLKLLVHAIPLTIILYLLFPRLSGPLWGVPDLPSASTGLSDSMSPGTISRISESDKIAFRINFTSEVPTTEQLYWRGPVFWRFDGRSWTNPYRHSKAGKIEYQPIGKATDYRITLEPHQRLWLFALDLPAWSPARAYLGSELNLISFSEIKKIFQYNMRSYLQYRIQTNFLDYRQRYLELPKAIAPKSRKLVNSWLRNTESREEIVQQALRYFRDNEFYYSRKPPLLIDDVLDEFLFESRRGYCEHYASSFALLMRLAGIPSRIVTGYLGMEYNDVGDYYIVRQARAHAWAEVWLAGKGWLRIDPTAVIPASRIEDQTDLARLQPQAANKLSKNKALRWLRYGWAQMQYAWDTLNIRWHQWIIDYNQQKQKSFFKDLGLPEIDWQGMTFIVMTLFSVALLFIAWQLFRDRKSSIDKVQKFYLLFCQKLARSTATRRENEGPADYANRVCELRHDLHEPVRLITNTYISLRYNNTASPELLNKFIHYVRRFKP